MVTAPAQPVGATLTQTGVFKGAEMILPVAVFFVPLGMAFGAAASAKSIPVLIVILMSVTVYAGCSTVRGAGSVDGTTTASHACFDRIRDQFPARRIWCCVVALVEGAGTAKKAGCGAERRQLLACFDIARERRD